MNVRARTADGHPQPEDRVIDEELWAHSSYSSYFCLSSSLYGGG